jgi:hypothetical protein
MVKELVQMTRRWPSCLVVHVDCHQLEAEHHLARLRTLSISTLVIGLASTGCNTATLVILSKILKTPSWTGGAAMRLAHQVTLYLLLLLRLQNMEQVRKGLFLLYRVL